MPNSAGGAETSLTRRQFCRGRSHRMMAASWAIIAC